MLWIALTIAAAPLQVARNALQRGLVEEAGLRPDMHFNFDLKLGEIQPWPRRPG